MMMMMMMNVVSRVGRDHVARGDFPDQSELAPRVRPEFQECRENPDLFAQETDHLTQIWYQYLFAVYYN